jgi:hypothetical protein
MEKDLDQVVGDWNMTSYWSAERTVLESALLLVSVDSGGYTVGAARHVMGVYAALQGHEEQGLLGTFSPLPLSILNNSKL